MMTSSHRWWSYQQSISYPKNAPSTYSEGDTIMHLHLNDKSALVTGATAGIGLEIARKLAVEGAKVIITRRNEAKLEPAVGSIRTSGGTYVSGVLADAATEEGAAALVRATRHL
jgi:NAD(P)-dependent dehydrogenase (short-subunit alcohol dehydrogenase family)